MSEILLDVKDKKILCQLDLNSRQSSNSIGKKTGLSKEVVNYRIKNLERNKVILGYYAALDLTKLGYMFCRIFMRCPSISPEQEEEIINYGISDKSIGWITSGQGKWNLSFSSYIRSIQEFEEIYENFRFKLGKYFFDHSVSIAFKIYHFKHNYLFGTKDLSMDVLGDGEKVGFDLIDRQILKMLAKDASVSLVEIGDKTGISATAASERIKRMVNKKIIISFRAKINTNLLGYEHHKVFLKFRDVDAKQRDKIFFYLGYEPSVIYITKAFGISDLEFEIMVKGKNEFHEFMQKFLANFSKFISDFDSILYYREWVNYFP